MGNEKWLISCCCVKTMYVHDIVHVVHICFLHKACPTLPIDPEKSANFFTPILLTTINGCTTKIAPSSSHLRLPHSHPWLWQWSPAHQRTAHKVQQPSPCQTRLAHWPRIHQTTWSAVLDPIDKMWYCQGPTPPHTLVHWTKKLLLLTISQHKAVNNILIADSHYMYIQYWSKTSQCI